MKPAWDELISEYEGSASALVADVDCTSDGGKDLCETQGVQGYPTIKWGEPSALQDYEGDRELSALKAFAAENLKPLCGPNNLELCDADKKKQITDLQAMSVADLDAEIQKKDAESKAAEDHFDAEVAKLQAKYEELEKEKAEKQASVKASGLSLMKGVKAAKAAGKEEL